ncbi:MAG: hypothetical protein EOO88_03310 [Pedobacter sp.]|nr:MAG: hypothetical protein EOO88_03310 [Pedobacter sp.]
MFQLLNPIGLLAALGIIVPVIVHLWNIKNGKTLKIGSIALLGSPSNQRSRNLRITDWPLLLLRSLMILLVALLLAVPIYQVKQTAAERPGWVVVERNDFSRVWKTHRKQLDSLLKKGFELHAFEPEFSSIELKDTSTVFSKPAKEPLSYFSLIKQLDEKLGPGFKVYAFTGNLLSRFSGARPVSKLSLNWQIAPVDDSLKTSWTTKAGDNGLNMLDAHTSPAGTYYTVSKNANGTTVQHVAIYQSSKAGGAAYVRAAVLALADFQKHKIEIQDISSLSQVKASGSFVFWLADQPLNAGQLNALPNGTKVLSYAGTKAVKLKSLITDQSGNSLDETELYQRTDAISAGTTVWSDGYGRPLLTKNDAGKVIWYQFYSRFSPQWTSMVWTNGMLTALLRILSPQEGPNYGFNEEGESVRAVTAANVFSGSVVSGKGEAVQSGYVDMALSNYIWWFIFAVFLVERWLSHRKTTHTS